VGKQCSNPQCFKEKKYKTKFSTSSILKNKIDKDHFRKKNNVGEHCSNSQCFVRKTTILILNQLIIKKNKIDKDNFEKNKNKNKHVGKHYNNPYYFVRKAIVLSSHEFSYIVIHLTL